MKLVTYLASGGAPRVGVVQSDAIYDLSGSAAAFDIALPTTMLDFLALGDKGVAEAQYVMARVESAGGFPCFAHADVRLLAPVPRPPKMLALAGNFQEHIKEGGGKAVDKTRITPRVFMKPSTSVIGSGQPVLLPRISQTIDWELELAVVLGKRGRYIKTADAMDYVAGYMVYNDVSARSLNIAKGRDARDGDGWFDWLNGKWLDSFGAMGPYLVTRDEIADVNNLAVRLYVNNELKQEGNTSQMIFNIAETISFASELMTMEPGDVIATGTPSGVGATTGTYLKAGDVVRGEIAGLGVLINQVAAEA